MHELDPFQRFLGVEESDDPVALLGLNQRPINSASIEQALRERLGRVYSHPDGRSSSAERVKKKLRWAADELRNPRQRSRLVANAQNGSTGSLREAALKRPDFSSRTTRPRLELTEFDRQVVATLVSSGGWNAGSRARLIALAAANNIGADGLLKVMTGLSEYGRMHGAHIDVDDITNGRSVSVMPRRAKPGALARAAVEAAERYTPEFREQNPWATVKLSILFGLMTVVAGILFLRVLISSSDPRAATEPVASDVAPAPLPGTGHTSSGAPPQTTETADRYGRMVRFETPPTFLGNSLPEVVSNSADKAVDLPEHLDDLQRRLIVLTGEPSEALLQNWRVSIETIAIGWPHVQANLVRKIDEEIRMVLLEASTKPDLADELLALLIPADRVTSPVEINRGAWQAGMLGRIAHSNLPPVVTDFARRLLHEVLPDMPAATEAPFRDAARAWLDKIAVFLIAQSHYDDRYADYWEMWLTAQTRLDRIDGRSGHSVGFDTSLLAVIELWLRSSTDLSSSGPGANVIGRLLNHLNFESNISVRDRVLSWFDDERITLDDLWVLTSMLALHNKHTTWFTAELVLVERDQNMAYRRRMRDRLAERWPEIRDDAQHASIRAAGRGLPADQAVAARWRSVLTMMEQHRSLGDSEHARLLHRLYLAANLNNAALLLVAGEPGRAETVLDMIFEQIDGAAFLQSDSPEHAQTRRDGGSDPVPAPPSPFYQQRHPMSTDRPGQPLGPDGQWAAAYENAGRSIDDRIALLTQLHRSAGTDLGLIDARLFVQLVYRGAPIEIRTISQQILLERFIDGPNVALQMLDQFPDAAQTRTVQDIVSLYTGANLPEGQTRQWQMSARLALTEQVLRLRVGSGSMVDQASAALLDVYNEQLTNLRRGDLLLTADSLNEAASWIHDDLRRRASSLAPMIEVPTHLNGLANRQRIRDRLAEGSIQRFVSQQLGAMEVLAYITVAEQPGLAESVRNLLAESSRQRDRAQHILQQAVEAELMGARLWNLRMEGAPLASTTSVEDSRSVLASEGRSASRAATAVKHAAVLIAMPAHWMQATSLQRDSLQKWQHRLEELDPASPRMYFELAEDVADVADSDAELALARRLFALAGQLDRSQYARGAALALADLETDGLQKRRLLALAALLDGQTAVALGRIVAGQAGLLDQPEAILGVVDAISYHRQGYGVKAQTALKAPGAMDLLHSLEGTLPGGVARFLENLRLYRSGKPPQSYSDDEEGVELRIQAGLLAGSARPWAADLQLNAGRPLLEVDPDDLEATFGHDADLSAYRQGRWVSER